MGYANPRGIVAADRAAATGSTGCVLEEEGSAFAAGIGHPKLELLYRHWLEKRGARLMPARADFDALDLRVWLGHLMLIDVLSGATEFRYRLYGSTLASYYGADYTGKTTRGIASDVADRVTSEYAQVSIERRPLLVQRKRAAPHSLLNIVKLILPLSADGIVVDMLLVGSYPETR
jgi:hypothetical protein